MGDKAMHEFQHRRRSNLSGSVGRDIARDFLGVTDAELDSLIIAKAIPAPVLSNRKTERFWLQELRAYLEARRAAARNT